MMCFLTKYFWFIISFLSNCLKKNENLINNNEQKKYHKINGEDGEFTLLAHKTNYSNQLVKSVVNYKRYNTITSMRSKYKKAFDIKSQIELDGTEIINKLNQNCFEPYNNLRQEICDVIKNETFIFPVVDNINFKLYDINKEYEIRSIECMIMMKNAIYLGVTLFDDNNSYFDLDDYFTYVPLINNPPWSAEIVLLIVKFLADNHLVL